MKRLSPVPSAFIMKTSKFDDDLTGRHLDDGPGALRRLGLSHTTAQYPASQSRLALYSSCKVRSCTGFQYHHDLHLSNHFTHPRTAIDIAITRFFPPLRAPEGCVEGRRVGGRRSTRARLVVSCVAMRRFAVSPCGPLRVARFEADKQARSSRLRQTL